MSGPLWTHELAVDEPVTSLSFGWAGRSLLAGARTHARWWSLGPGHVGGDRLEVHDSGRGVLVAASDRSGPIVAAVGVATVQVPGRRSGRQATEFAHPGGVTGIVVTESWLVTTGGDGVARIWHTGDGREIGQLRHDAAVRCVAAGANGRRLATGAADGTVRVWHAWNRERVFELRHEGVYGVAFVRGDAMLATAGDDRVVRIWAGTRRPLAEIRHGAAGPVAFGPRGTRLAVADGATVRTWDLVTGAELDRLRLDHAVTRLAFSPDDRTLAVACDDRVVRVVRLGGEGGPPQESVRGRIRSFAGLPVEYPGAWRETAPDPEAVAWCIDADAGGIDPERFADGLAETLDTIGAVEVRALLVGDWGEPHRRPAPVRALVAAAGRLVNLRALYLGAMSGEQCEISWIRHTDVTPLLTAYPRLETLRVRGSDGLALTPVRHEALRELVFESGGLPGSVVRAVGGCDLPALERLELWLGVDEYGGDATVEDLAGILGGARLPRLRYLGLRDARIADALAVALAGAPIVARLDELDLSLGALSDAGAEALLAGQPLTHLRRLSLSHHFLSGEMIGRLVTELPGVDVDVSNPQLGADVDERYVAVAE